jgi:hypothetical protein
MAGIGDGGPQLSLAQSARRNRFDWLAPGCALFHRGKTRTTRDVKPAEAAVDRDRRRELLAVAREYLRHLPSFCLGRLQVISVYYDDPSGQPQAAPG